MNSISPRSSSAPRPLYSTKPLPESLVPRAKSIRPRSVAMSQCGLGGEVELGRLAVRFDDLEVFFGAGRRGLVGQVGDVKQQVVALGFQSPRLVVQGRDAVAEFAVAGFDASASSRLPSFMSCPMVPRLAVAVELGLEVLGLGGDGPPARVGVQHGVNGRGVGQPRRQPFLDEFRVGSD